MHCCWLGVACTHLQVSWVAAGAAVVSVSAAVAVWQSASVPGTVLECVSADLEILLDALLEVAVLEDMLVGSSGFVGWAVLCDFLALPLFVVERYVQ